MTTFHSRRSPVGSTPSHGAWCVADTSASSQTPCGPITMSVRSKRMSGNAVRSSRVEPRGALVPLPAVAGLDELVDAVRGERRDQPGQVARVLGDRVRLVELADLGVELRRDLPPVDLEDGAGRPCAESRAWLLESPGVDLDLLFLGTSASMPTAQRAPAAFLVRRGGEKLLFDCAEGTQRQLQRSVVGLADLEDIFLTHLHGDHFLGLPGMLKTFALRGRDERALTVHGPRG